jgi:hypothetical protein
MKVTKSRYWSRLTDEHLEDLGPSLCISNYKPSFSKISQDMQCHVPISQYAVSRANFTICSVMCQFHNMQCHVSISQYAVSCANFTIRSVMCQFRYRKVNEKHILITVNYFSVKRRIFIKLSNCDCMFDVVMLYYISLPIWPDVCTLCTLAIAEDFLSVEYITEPKRLAIYCIFSTVHYKRQRLVLCCGQLQLLEGPQMTLLNSQSLKTRNPLLSRRPVKYERKSSQNSTEQHSAPWNKDGNANGFVPSWM